MAGLLLPALNKAKQSAKATQCTANKKTFAICFANYANDYNEYFIPTQIARPGTDLIKGILASQPTPWYQTAYLYAMPETFATDQKGTCYDKFEKIFSCPLIPSTEKHLSENNIRAYGITAFIVGTVRQTEIATYGSVRKIHKVKTPGQKLLIGDKKLLNTMKLDDRAYIEEQRHGPYKISGLTVSLAVVTWPYTTDVGTLNNMIKYPD